MQLLRIPDNVRLWIAFCEDWSNEENEEALATALAASGTLAVASSDNVVAHSLTKEGCGSCIAGLISSKVEGLTHRGLVVGLELVHNVGITARDELGNGGVVDALKSAIAVYRNNGRIIDLCKELAEAMAAVPEPS